MFHCERSDRGRRRDSSGPERRGGGCNRRRSRGALATSDSARHHGPRIDRLAIQWPVVVGGADVRASRRVAPLVIGS